MASHLTNPLTVCLTGEDSDSSVITQACMVSGTGLLMVAGATSFIAMMAICTCVRRSRARRHADLVAASASASAARLQASRRARQFDRAARVAYICGIMHVCTCLCYWMILRRTPYYYVMTCFAIGMLWMCFGNRLTKRSNYLLSQSDEMEQLLRNLLDDYDEEDGIGRELTGPPPVAPPLPGETGSEISEDENFSCSGSQGGGRSGVNAGGGNRRSFNGVSPGVAGAGEKIEEVPMADEAIEVESDEDLDMAVRVSEDVMNDVETTTQRDDARLGRGAPEEEKTDLPIAIGEAVNFADGEDPFDDSTEDEDCASSGLEDDDSSGLEEYE